MSLGRLYSFLKTHSKVHVQVPGCIKELDQLADEFVKDKTKREEILKTAEDIIAKIEDEEVNNTKYKQLAYNFLQNLLD